MRTDARIAGPAATTLPGAKAERPARPDRQFRPGETGAWPGYRLPRGSRPPRSTGGDRRQQLPGLARRELTDGGQRSEVPLGSLPRLDDLQPRVPGDVSGVVRGHLRPGEPAAGPVACLQAHTDTPLPAPGRPSSVTTTPPGRSSSPARRSNRIGFSPMPMFPSASSTVEHRVPSGTGSWTEACSTSAPEARASWTAAGATSTPVQAVQAVPSRARISRPGPQPTSRVALPQRASRSSSPAALTDTQRGTFLVHPSRGWRRADAALLRPHREPCETVRLTDAPGSGPTAADEEVDACRAFHALPTLR